MQKGMLNIDPVTRTAITSPDTRASYKPAPNKLGAIYNNTAAVLQNTNNNSGTLCEEGPMLVIESDHPYQHNTNEYTTVQIPGAVSYTVTFHEDTRTEPVYDFVKFYDDETHTDFFGASKYSGGYNNSPGNWPGINGRPPLIIPSKKFIIHFKTNGSVNDW